MTEPRIGRIDAFQRKHAILGFPIAVIYKYFDDQGPYLAAIISYYAFIAIFPLLLISTSILGFVLQDDPDLRDRLLDSALSQFPIVGDALGRPNGLNGSTGAIVIGSLAALYGSMGLGQATQNAANIAWSVPRNSRANPFLLRLRSIFFLAASGLGILLIAVITTLFSNPDQIGVGVSREITFAIKIVGFLLSVLIFGALFRLVSGGRGSWRSVLPGAATTALLWQLLQVGGQSFVENVINKASSMNSTFALVLGLMAFIFLAAVMAVLGLEVNVVTARKLYPRALLTPFTDNVVLTDADQKAYAAYAKSQRHKGFQSVEVTFEDRKPKPPLSD
ncbi:YihY family inner membrane protein [Aeromicrobium panaciterrae]|uniref:YihY family inner membrane protein n=1 Tax=Aeromicrobium panaciterrae TaxID=363861 RepID=A0ABU1ULF0_9ACTN|nr:YihY/virulence factor BrkB family protein [Aeromicrobium panaciterrae]MDR7086012.1 YihY family inner membrane protein [Aeromicrobium panaciterrae]